MLPDRVLNPGPLTYKSGALPTVLRGQAAPSLKNSSKRLEKWKINLAIPGLVVEYVIHYTTAALD